MTQRSLLARLWQHVWCDEATLRRALPKDMLHRLGQRVSASEQRHTGEIRIYAEASLPLSYLWRHATPRQRAVAMFGKLRVWDTEHNNGVLIYLLLAERAIEIVADRALARAVPQQEWRAIVERLGASLRDGKFEDGLTQSLEEVSALLVQHFPSTAGEGRRNELPDEPVLG